MSEKKGDVSEDKLVENIDSTNIFHPKILDKLFYHIFFFKLRYLITKKNPSEIFFTFPCFPLLVPSSFLGKVTIQVTDYISPHLSWAWGRFNEIRVLDKESKIYLSSFIDKKKIIISKFPLHNNIKYTYSKNIEKKIPHIVFFFHNILLGNEKEVIEKSIYKFPKSTITILAGRNYSFFSQIYSSEKNIKIYSWQKNIVQFYKKADIVGGKCGGAFISEVMGYNIPIIVTGVFSGQEQGNYKYLHKYYAKKIINL